MADTSYTDLNLFHTVDKDASCSTIKRKTIMTKHCYGVVFILCIVVTGLIMPWLVIVSKFGTKTSNIDRKKNYLNC
jgi:hypothetical protein